MPPLVSILMPAYNAAAFIGEAIGSVLAQTEPRWELLIVDDGSTDRTAAIAAGFPDPRIRLFTQPNGGEAAARNTALRHARGSHIAFLDADDVFLPGHLETALALLSARPANSGVYSDGFYVDARGTRLAPLSSRRRGTFEGDVFEQTVRASDALSPPCCIVLKAESIGRARLEFDTGLQFGVDWDFLTRFAEHGRFLYADRPTCLYRVHQTNLSRRVAGRDRDPSHARCREKAIRLPRFPECSLSTRAYAFYDLLVALLDGQPARQAAITEWPQFRALPVKEQARLWRLMASHAVVGGGGRAWVEGCLARSAVLDPADRRGSAVNLLFRAAPRLCRLALKLRRFPNARPSAAFPPGVS